MLRNSLINMFQGEMLHNTAVNILWSSAS